MFALGEASISEIGFYGAISLLAATFGFIMSLSMLERVERIEYRKRIRSNAGSVSKQEVSRVALESDGFNVSVILFVLDCSMMQEQRIYHFLIRIIWGIGLKNCSLLIEKAGLSSVLTIEGVIRARMRLSLIGALLGYLIGLCFSNLMAILLMISFFIIGYSLVTKALKSEVEERAFHAEKQLSEMIEIVILGLKSGLSFDHSLSFYCNRFDGSLSRDMDLALREWSYGLITRSQGLKRVARSYDSPLFQRTFESINRSLRFGTSLAESLHLSASEARSFRKTKLEERIAKAPVKMLVPVGSLILPAMLILIIGPILLDLMSGF